MLNHIPMKYTIEYEWKYTPWGSCRSHKEVFYTYNAFVERSLELYCLTNGYADLLDIYEHAEPIRV